MLKSTQHFLWDLISGEVSKFWKDLRRLEVKKSYILAALERHKLATEQLAHLHKSPDGESPKYYYIFEVHIG